ncbi:MAG: hypothetical protein OS112_05990 [Methanoregula sp.]|nr:MAG: hypothetical protein OS112_05990 [Methanoregula sp.]
MDICKNADEYEREIWKLREEAYREYRQKKIILNASFDTIEEPTIQDYKNLDMARYNLFQDCLKQVRDFENRHPIKPFYIFKKGRKYHELKNIEENPGLWISPKPIIMQILNAKNSEWVLEVTFPGSAVDVATCPHCKDKFIRYGSHQKYCPSCQRNLKTIGFNPGTDIDKHRYCLNCGKHLPNTKHGKTKYCCGACRTSACKKRKSVIVSPGPSEVR